MQSLTTKARDDSPENTLKEDRSNDYMDQDMEMDPRLDVPSTDSSDAAEMNNNTNGKILTMGPYVCMDGNRQQITGAPVNVPVNPTVMKKIKRIYMEETPLQLSGLSLSGSGMELFLKMDENLDKTLQQVNSMSVNKRPMTTRRKKKMARTNKKAKEYLQVMPPTEKEQEAEGLQPRYADSDNPVLEELKAIESSAEGLKKRSPTDLETTGQLNSKNSLDEIDSHNKVTVAEHMRHKLQMPSQNQQTFHPYGYNPNFQPSPNSIPNSIIPGPLWTVENGHIHVLESKATFPSSSNIQTVNDDPESPIDYSMDPFTGGFRSNHLPLKRRLAPPRRPGQHTSTDYTMEFEDGVAHIQKDSRQPQNFGKVKKLPVGRTAKDSIVEDNTTAQFLPNVLAKAPSEVSVQQSSVGPQFQTDLLSPQVMDAETLIKFVDYTHAVRKDLKQKYKDISHLLKTMEKTVEYKHRGTDEDNGTEEPRVGRCDIM